MPPAPCRATPDRGNVRQDLRDREAMAPSPKPELPMTDYLGNRLKVNDQITFVGTNSLTNRPRLYKGTIVFLTGTEMCVQSGGLRVLQGEACKNPDRITFLDVALQPPADGA